MIPPGLAFVSISPRAWERQAQARLPKFYFDWLQARRAADDGMTPWTPALSLFFGLQAALKLMRDEGLERLFERHRRLGAVHPRRPGRPRPAAGGGSTVRVADGHHRLRP